MKFNSLKELVLSINPPNGFVVTGEVALTILGVFNYQSDHNYNINFIESDSNLYKDGIPLDSPENALFYHILKEENKNFNILYSEEIFELLSIYYNKFKTFNKLKKRVNILKGYEQEVFYKLLEEVEEKYGFFDE